MIFKISLFIYLSFLLHNANAFNITKLLDQYPAYSTFNSYLTQTNLAKEINSRRTITVLAVDNGNISPLVGKPLDVLRKIISLHVVLDYLDVQKLQNLPNKTALITTFFQAIGQPFGQKGLLNVTQMNNETVVFSLVGTGSMPGANLVKSILAQPYNISLLQISTVIVPLGYPISPSPAKSPTPTISIPPETPTPAPAPSVPPPETPTPAPVHAPAPASNATEPPVADTPDTSPVGPPPMPTAPTADAPEPEPPADDSAAPGTTLLFHLRVLMILVPLVMCFLWDV